MQLLLTRDNASIHTSKWRQFITSTNKSKKLLDIRIAVSVGPTEHKDSVQTKAQLLAEFTHYCNASSVVVEYGSRLAIPLGALLEASGIPVMETDIRP
jgi:hypothetical protein